MIEPGSPLAQPDGREEIMSTEKFRTTGRHIPLLSSNHKSVQLLLPLAQKVQDVAAH